MALKQTTRQGVELTVRGEIGRFLRLKYENTDIEIELDDKEIDELVYMLKGY